MEEFFNAVGMVLVWVIWEVPAGVDDYVAHEGFYFILCPFFGGAEAKVEVDVRVAVFVGRGGIAFSINEVGIDGGALADQLSPRRLGLWFVCFWW
mgnify:CR=1 FL=1